MGRKVPSLFLYLCRLHYIMLQCQGRVMCVLNCCWMMVQVPTCRWGIINTLNLTRTLIWLILHILFGNEFAIVRENYIVITWLIHSKQIECGSFHFQCKNGRTPLHYAALYGRCSRAQTLLQNGNRYIYLVYLHVVDVFSQDLPNWH